MPLTREQRRKIVKAVIDRRIREQASGTAAATHQAQLLPPTIVAAANLESSATSRRAPPPSVAPPKPATTLKEALGWFLPLILVVLSMLGLWGQIAAVVLGLAWAVASMVTKRPGAGPSLTYEN